MKRRQMYKVVLTLIGVMMLGGCSQQVPPEAGDVTTEVETTVIQEDVEVPTTETMLAEVPQGKAKSIAEIYSEITGSVTLYSPMEFDDEFLMNYYGIDASLLEEYVFSMSEDATSAETIVVMKAKSADDVESLSASLQVVVDEKKNEMENYLPEQFAIVEKSTVQTKDNYIWLVISENADTIFKMIEDGIQ